LKKTAVRSLPAVCTQRDGFFKAPFQVAMNSQLRSIAASVPWRRLQRRKVRSHGAGQKEVDNRFDMNVDFGGIGRVPQAKQNLQMNISAEHRNELTGDDGRLVNIDLAAQLRLLQHFADGLDRPLGTVCPIRIRRRRLPQITCPPGRTALSGSRRGVMAADGRRWPHGYDCLASSP
jgi:hypothetical protein